MGQALLMALIMGNLGPFSTDVAFGPGMVFVRPDPGDPVAIGLDFKAAVMVTERTKRLFPFQHDFPPTFT